MGGAEERETRLFPDQEHQDQKITCHDITPDFLIFGTDVSNINTNMLAKLLILQSAATSLLLFY